jgi:DNA-binding beta-propeller fold protein YncE
MAPILDFEPSQASSRTTVAAGPTPATINPTTHRVYVANGFNSPTVSVITLPLPRRAIQLLIERVKGFVGIGALTLGQGDTTAR